MAPALWFAVAVLSQALPCPALRRTQPAQKVPEGCKGWKSGGLEKYVDPAGALELDPTVWEDSVFKLRGDFPLTADSVRRASAPLNYTGDRSRLAAAAAKLLAGEPLKITVTGAHSHWAESLGKYFQKLGHTAVNVSIVGKPGTTSEKALEWIEDPAFQTADVVLVDFSVNDGMHREDDGGPEYDELVQTLFLLPRKPAVVDLEIWHRSNGNGTKPVPGTEACTQSFEELIHARARDAKLPMITFSDAVCHTHGS